jgi:hypothetical protein
MTDRPQHDDIGGAIVMAAIILAIAFGGPVLHRWLFG